MLLVFLGFRTSGFGLAHLANATQQNTEKHHQRRGGVVKWCHGIKVLWGHNAMYSILEFCKFAGISRSAYYTLKKRNEGPKETHILSRVGINRDTAAEWLRAQESAEAKAA